MVKIAEIVALLPKQADLETAILSGQRSAVVTEQEIGAPALFAHPQVLSGMLQIVHAVWRIPDTIEHHGGDSD
jgi:hypothetical protein